MSGKAKIFVLRKGKRKLLWLCRLLTTRSELTQGIMHSPNEFTPCLFVFPIAARWRNAIHSFFCPPFDAIFVDEDFRVIEALQVAPNNLLVVPRSKAKYLLELPAGQANRKSVKIGEKLKFEFVQG